MLKVITYRDILSRKFQNKNAVFEFFWRWQKQAADATGGNSKAPRNGRYVEQKGRISREAYRSRLTFWALLVSLIVRTETNRTKADEVALAKKHGTKNKRQALSHLKRKKRLEKQQEQIGKIFRSLNLVLFSNFKESYRQVTFIAYLQNLSFNFSEQSF